MSTYADYNGEIIFSRDLTDDEVKRIDELLDEWAWGDGVMFAPGERLLNVCATLKAGCMEELLPKIVAIVPASGEVYSYGPGWEDLYKLVVDGSNVIEFVGRITYEEVNRTAEDEALLHAARQAAVNRGVLSGPEWQKTLEDD